MNQQILSLPFFHTTFPSPVLISREQSASETGSEINKRHMTNLHELAGVPCCMTLNSPSLTITDVVEQHTLFNNKSYNTYNK